MADQLPNDGALLFRMIWKDEYIFDDNQPMCGEAVNVPVNVFRPFLVSDNACLESSASPAHIDIISRVKCPRFLWF